MKRLAAALAILALSLPLAHAEPEPAPSRRTRKLAAAGGVGLIHAAYATWSYFAWYRGSNPRDFHYEISPALGLRTYAGGADKLGHFWANYTLARGTSRLLADAGWDPVGASLVAAGLTEVSFLLTEIQDGYTVGFDRHDLVANVAGAMFAVTMENVPDLDRLIDFRLEYFPSRDYRRHARDGNASDKLDIAQDYSGQSYLLALHLGELPRMQWAHYVDLVAGFETRNYDPSPADPHAEHRQVLYLGVALDAQAVLRRVFCPTPGRRIGEGVFEVFSLPFTTAKLPVATSGFVP